MPLSSSTDLIERPRLLRALDSSARLTVLRAPTGFGKTTLLRQWWSATDARHPTAWVTAPEASATATAYWELVLDSFARAGVPTGKPAGSHEPDREHAAVRLILDSYERAPAEVDELLQRWVAHRPVVHVTVSTRTRRAFDRADRHGLDVRTFGPSDLAFNHAEAEELFRALSVADASSRARVCRDQTEGWPAVLHAIGSAIARAPGEVRDDRVARRAALGFLNEAVLPSLAKPRLASLLLASAVPEHLTAEIASVLSPGDTGAYLLSCLEDEGVLVREVVDGEAVYRWPPLARAVLSEKLEQEQPLKVRELHRSLARLHRGRRRFRSSLKHAVQGEDWTLATQVLVADWVRLIGTHRDEVAAFFSRVPRSRVAEHSLLSLIARIVTPVPPVPRPRADDELARRAEEFLAATTVDGDSLDIGLALLLALTRRGDFERASAIALRLMELLRDSPDVVWEVAERLPWAGLGVGVIHQIQGDFDSATSALKMAHSAAKAVKRPDVGAAAAERLAMQLAFAGHNVPARAWLDRAEALTHDAPPDRMGGLIARLLLALDELDASRADEVRQAVLAQGIVDSDDWAYVGHALASHALLMGDRAGALATVQQLRARHAADVVGHNFMQVIIDVAEADLLMALGRLGDARDVLDRDAVPHPMHTVCRARLSLLTGEFEGAMKLAASTVPDHATTRRTRIDALVVQAAAASYLRLDGQAAKALQAAVDAAQRPGGVRWHFALVPHGIGLRFSVLNPASAQIVQALEASGCGEVFPAPVLLTERERLVLQRLALGLGSRELARELYVSANTIKTQLRSIYRKLGVTSRAQALQVAADLGLVGRD